MQIILTKVILLTGILAITTRNYVLSISGLLEVIAFAFSRGNQIIMGRLVGGQKF